MKKPYDIKRVIRLHNTIIEDTGGVQGILDVGLLEEALFKPFMGLANGEELYPGIIKKAAILFEALINYHPFADGNKRTAEIVTEIFLENSGYYWDFNEDEIVDFATEVANGKLSIKEIENWIANRIRKKRLINYIITSVGFIGFVGFIALIEFIGYVGFLGFIEFFGF